MAALGDFQPSIWRINPLMRNKILSLVSSCGTRRPECRSTGDPPDSRSRVVAIAFLVGLEEGAHPWGDRREVRHSHLNKPSYALTKKGVPKPTKEILLGLKPQMNPNTAITGDFNTHSHQPAGH